MDRFSCAFQAINKDWLPNDWYLNQPLGSQLLTGIFIGPLIKYFGFMHASIIARFISYILLSTSIATLTRKLQVPIIYVFSVLLVFIIFKQGIGAGEYIFGGVESKVFAYASIFFGIYYLIDKKYLYAAMLFGIATSFHFLVGGYAIFSGALFALLYGIKLRIALKGTFIYMVFGVVGIVSVAKQFNHFSDMHNVSWIYVYFRNPHHLVPSQFAGFFLSKLILVCLGWIITFCFTREYNWVHRILIFAAMTMIPFFAGLAIAPFDHTGRFLKFYPFRLGDSVFPLIILFCGYFCLKRWFSELTLRKILICSAVFTLIQSSFVFVHSVSKFDRSLNSESEWVGVCDWIRDNTLRESIVISPPAMETFTILAQRATVVQFKFVPYSMSGVSEWYQRLLDLNGKVPISERGFNMTETLNMNYFNMSEDQIKTLMKKYNAQYALTVCRDWVELSLVYSNEKYCVVSFPGQITTFQEIEKL